MGGNQFRRLRGMTARIGLFTAQILLGLLYKQEPDSRDFERKVAARSGRSISARR
jgi:hypothetical protein